MIAFDNLLFIFSPGVEKFAGDDKIAASDKGLL
jgi:hypothetical protein